MQLRLGVWNAEWARSGTKRGEGVQETLRGGAFDIVCLTEAYEELLPALGHIICSEPDYGYPITPGRRKVILWSRHPWNRVDTVGSAALPRGRFVRGVTESPLGPVRVVGVCIPWNHAHVTSGRKDRKPWEDHLRYLEGLKSLLGYPAREEPTIVAGDFNQRIPRAKAPGVVFDALMAAMTEFHFATAGAVEPLGQQLIDHVAHNEDLIAMKVRCWSGTRPDGLSLSDHDGVCVELGRRF